MRFIRGQTDTWESGWSMKVELGLRIPLGHATIQIHLSCEEQDHRWLGRGRGGGGIWRSWGQLITARLAQDYDRRVFALSPTWCAEAMGGNARLIQEQVAELLHAPEDLPRAMGWRAGNHRVKSEGDGDADLAHG